MQDVHRTDANRMAGGSSDRTRAFGRARRHSRRVRMLRVAVPAGLAVVLAGFFAAAWLDPMRLLKRLPIDAGGLVISGTKITMAAPKLSGYTRDQRWYEVTASAAAQDITKPDLVEMQNIQARLEMQDKSTLNLTAADGLFDRKVGTLTLGKRIVLKSTGGVEILLSDARVDTATGHIVSEQPVEVRMEQGTLNARKLEVTDSGEVIRFHGGVVMNLKGGALDQINAKTGTP
jgi:lipopolysaccharide export system protein LptC